MAGWRPANVGPIAASRETVFSALTTVCNVQRPRGWSLARHLVRIATCLLAHTLSFFMQEVMRDTMDDQPNAAETRL